MDFINKAIGKYSITRKIKVQHIDFFFVNNIQQLYFSVICSEND